MALRGSAGAARHSGRDPGRQGPVSPPGDPGPHRPHARPRRSTRHARARRAAARSVGRPDRRGTARHRLGAAASRGCSGRPAAAGPWRRSASASPIPMPATSIEKLQALRRQGQRHHAARPAVASDRRAARAADPPSAPSRPGRARARQCRSLSEPQPRLSRSAACAPSPRR